MSDEKFGGESLLEDTDRLLGRVDSIMSLGFKKHEGRMSVPDFFRMVVEHQAWHLANNARQRIRDALGVEGFSRGSTGIRRSNFLGTRLIGVDHFLAEAEAAIYAMAEPGQMGKSALTLVGPPSGGKTTFAGLIFAAAERFTKPQEGDMGVGPGAFYGIVGCPLHDNPLHFLPDQLKSELWEQYGIEISGGLCPVCRHSLREYGRSKAHKGELFSFFDYCDEKEISVERLTLSKRSGVGVGYIFPFRPQDMTMAPFLGEIAIREMGRYDADDPRVWNYRVAQTVLGNRGGFHFEEGFRADEAQTRILLTQLEEGFISAGPFKVYLDEFIIMTTNEPNFLQGARDIHQQALLDRMFFVHAPYSIETIATEHIFVSLMGESQDNDSLPDGGLQRVHRDPLAVSMVSFMVGLSRLAPLSQLFEKPEKDIDDRLRRLSIINRAAESGSTESEQEEAQKILVPLKGMSGISSLRNLLDEHPINGMRGISNRFIANALQQDASKIMLQQGNGDASSSVSACQTTERALSVIFTQLQLMPRAARRRIIGDAEEDILPLLAGAVMTEWERLALISVDEALWGEEVTDSLNKVLDRYLMAIAFMESDKSSDDDAKHTKSEKESDADSLKRIKEFVVKIEDAAGIGVSESSDQRIKFLATAQLYGVSIEHFPDLETSIREYIREKSARSIMKVFDGTDNPSKEDKKIFKKALKRLQDGQGCCKTCARERLEFLKS